MEKGGRSLPLLELDQKELERYAEMAQNLELEKINLELRQALGLPSTSTVESSSSSKPTLERSEANQKMAVVHSISQQLLLKSKAKESLVSGRPMSKSQKLINVTHILDVLSRSEDELGDLAPQALELFRMAEDLDSYNDGSQQLLDNSDFISLISSYKERLVMKMQNGYLPADTINRINQNIVYLNKIILLSKSEAADKVLVSSIYEFEDKKSSSFEETFTRRPKRSQMNSSDQSVNTLPFSPPASCTGSCSEIEIVYNSKENTGAAGVSSLIQSSSSSATTTRTHGHCSDWTPPKSPTPCLGLKRITQITDTTEMNMQPKVRRTSFPSPPKAPKKVFMDGINVDFKSTRTTVASKRNIEPEPSNNGNRTVRIYREMTKPIQNIAPKKARTDNVNSTVEAITNVTIPSGQPEKPSHKWRTDRWTKIDLIPNTKIAVALSRKVLKIPVVISTLNFEDSTRTSAPISTPTPIDSQSTPLKVQHIEVEPNSLELAKGAALPLTEVKLRVPEVSFGVVPGNANEAVANLDESSRTPKGIPTIIDLRVSDSEPDNEQQFSLDNLNGGATGGLLPTSDSAEVKSETVKGKGCSDSMSIPSAVAEKVFLECAGGGSPPNELNETTGSKSVEMQPKSLEKKPAQTFGANRPAQIPPSTSFPNYPYYSNPLIHGPPYMNTPSGPAYQCGWNEGSGRGQVGPPRFGPNFYPYVPYPPYYLRPFYYNPYLNPYFDPNYPIPPPIYRPWLSPQNSSPTTSPIPGTSSVHLRPSTPPVNNSDCGFKPPGELVDKVYRNPQNLVHITPLVPYAKLSKD